MAKKVHTIHLQKNHPGWPILPPRSLHLPSAL